jgi:hypothetical protein
LEMEWGESGGNNKQGRRGGNPWLVSNWSLDYSLVRCPNIHLTSSYNKLLNFHWFFRQIEIRVHDEFYRKWEIKLNWCLWHGIGLKWVEITSNFERKFIAPK